jgi:hypothetical protein
MGNTFQNITTGLPELKNRYIGPIVDQFNEDLPIMRAAEKVKEGWNGYQIVRPLRVRRNPGIGATSDGGLLPSVGAQTTVQALISAKFNYLRFGITGPMIKSSASDAGAFVRGFDYEMTTGYKDFKSDMNRQFSWNGDGKLATVSANAVASTVISITGRESVEAALKFLDVGMVIDFITTGGAVSASAVTITAVTGTFTAASATITLNSPVTVSSTDFIVRTGSYNNEVNGLLYALDGLTTSIYSVNRATYPQYQSNVISASSNQLTLDRMQQAYNEGLRRGGEADSSYSAIYCDFDSLRYYQKLLTSDKRYVNKMEGDGGFAMKGKFYLDFNGVPLVQDKDCPQRLFFIPDSALKNYVLCEMEPADETGSAYIAQPSVDAFETRLRYFTNLFNEKPAGCAVLSTYISP